MKVPVKVYISPRKWRTENIEIPDSITASLFEERDEDWFIGGKNPFDELYEWIFQHLRDRIGTTGAWGDGKQEAPPAMFRILAF